MIGSWGDGLTELSARFHDEWRARPQHPRRPRPVTLNTWEAVYFDHSLDKLTALADAAAGVGVERFVLDDGWFTGRRDDTAGLGDWFVDESVWPDGLHPLIDHVRELGMEFGLWVEPEMINPDSDLARRHPDWILRGRMALPPSARQQQVLDLAHPEAYAYIAGRLHALLDEYPIAYLKWDHNRDLVDAGSGPEGVARVHAHTLAVYRLLDELKARHPGLEIESCASGGARVDLGILDRTDRIWTSDSLDPLERLDEPAVHRARRAARADGHAPDQPGRALLRAHRVARAQRRRRPVRPLRHRVGPHLGRRGDARARSPRGSRSPSGCGRSSRPAASCTSTAPTPASMCAAWSRRTRHPPSSPSRRPRHPSPTRRVACGCRGSTPTAGTACGCIATGEHGDDPGQSPLAWAQHDTVLTGRELESVGLRPPVQFPQQATVVELTADHLTDTPTAPRARRRTHENETPNDPPERSRCSPRRASRSGWAAARAAPSDGVTTLNFFQFKGEALEDFNEIIADFEAENPDIRVVQNQVADADTIIRTLLVKDKAPDVITLNANGGFGKLAQAGVFYDFSDEPVLQTINPAVQEILADSRQQGGRGQRPRLRQQRQRRDLQPGRSSRSRASRCPRRGTSSSRCATR